MRFAVGLPNRREYADPGLLVDLAVLAEDSGWDGVFVWDHLVDRERGAPATDPWIASAAIAQATERVRLGVMVCVLPRRRPWKVARETAALDRLSDGRLVFGAGLGARPEEDFEPFGEDGNARVRADLLDEGLEIVTGLWSGQPFSFSGERYRVEDAVFRPPPVQSPRPPVWTAGTWPARRPFRRAARWDGVFPTHAEVSDAETMTPEQLGEIVDYTLSHRSADGPFDVAMEGVSTAEERVDGAYAKAGLTWWIEKLGWFRGPLEPMRSRIAAGPPA
jgi:alkanesulfonate monooxygenase SsuD/methylene tetrahydromethanopterin reductase-like flavin-dependent oxidoreductase (luciferase family)